MSTKALVVEQKISDSVMHLVHGMTYMVRRILIPYKGRKMLSITFQGKDVYVFPMNAPNPKKDDPKEYRLIREVEISDEFAAHAKNFFDARQKMLAQKRKFSFLLADLKNSSVK